MYITIWLNHAITLFPWISTLPASNERAPPEWALTSRMSAHLPNKHPPPPPNKRAPLVHDVKQVPLSSKRPHPLPLPCPPSLF